MPTLRQTRWHNYTQQELNLIHHALRMLAKFSDEDDHATTLADEAWAEHIRRSQASYPDMTEPR